VDNFFLFRNSGDTTGLLLIGLIGRHCLRPGSYKAEFFHKLLNLEVRVGIQDDGALLQ